MLLLPLIFTTAIPVVIIMAEAQVAAEAAVATTAAALGAASG